jgi:hypothetical protein
MSRDYLMLPEQENFIRIRECDFNKEENIETLQSSKIPGTLKNIKNPMLILFYYNDTHKNILLEFFESRNSLELETGDEKDYVFGSDKDTQFKLGFVNLDLETGVLELFRSFKAVNPFVWCRIEKEKDDYLKIPFILFYYDTLPQFMYEGVVDSRIISKEFKNWRTELRELENEELKDRQKLEMRKEGYYTALKDDYPVKGIVQGKTYFITTTRTTEGVLDYRMVPI